MIIEVRDVSKTFEKRKVLEIESFIIEKPGVYSLLGPNGAGKTTFFNIITGLIKPDSGRVLVKGRPVDDPVVKKTLGYCTQEYGLIDLLTGVDNALFYSRLYGISDREALKTLYELAERIGLRREDLNRKVGKYSGGMKRKLSIIVSILHNPEILVLDEPTTGLDPSARREIWELIREYSSEGRTILLATHYMDEADVLSNWVFIVNHGKIIAEGSPEELKIKHAPKTIVELVLEKNPDQSVSEVISSVSKVFTISDNRLRVSLEEPEKDIPILIGDLFRHGYNVVEFKMSKPTLEDVFLVLTGRRLTEP